MHEIEAHEKVCKKECYKEVRIRAAEGSGSTISVGLAFEACLVWSEYLMFPLWAHTAAAAGVGCECAGLLQ